MTDDEYRDVTDGTGPQADPLRRRLPRFAVFGCDSPEVRARLYAVAAPRPHDCSCHCHRWGHQCCTGHAERVVLLPIDGRYVSLPMCDACAADVERRRGAG